MNNKATYCPRCTRRLSADSVHVYRGEKHSEVHRRCATPTELDEQQARLKEAWEQMMRRREQLRIEAVRRDEQRQRAAVVPAFLLAAEALMPAEGIHCPECGERFTSAIEYAMHRSSHGRVTP
ncbi:MAG TPA: hypothetical protein VFO27_00030 [Bryobacteraceae bacterium]|nr:hypothetical protein [Bryobacteraceae bacterium]